MAERVWSGPDPDDITAWALVQAGHVVSRRFATAYAEFGLTPAQFGVLLLLDVEPGLSGGEMARRVFMSPQSMSELMSSLNQKGLITRDGTATRGQRIATHITARGAELLTRAATVIDQVNGDAALRLTRSESVTLNRLLHKIIDTD